MLPPNTLVCNRYRVVRLIGQGGMGSVYEAVDQRLGSTVALKQMVGSGEIFDRAFEHEARILARLRHPALPKVFDHFADESGHFLVMEFIPGSDLGALLAQRGAPFPVADVLQWADQLLDVLEYLHAQQPPVIHRDIKPQNLKLTPGGEIILLDFGLSKGVALSQLADARSIAGYTPQYASPEQFQGSGTDARSDLFALAATLYCLLAGQPPANVMARTLARGDRRPDPLQPLHALNPEAPPAVSAVLLRALALDPARRPPNAAAMRGELRAASARPARPTRRRWLWPVAVAAALLLTLVVGLASRVLVVPSVTGGTATEAPVVVTLPTLLATAAVTDAPAGVEFGGQARPSDPSPPPQPTSTPTSEPTPAPPAACQAGQAAANTAIACFAPELEAALLKSGYEQNIVAAGNRRGLGTSPRGGTALWSRDLEYSIAGFSYALGDMALLRQSIELFLRGARDDGFVPDQIVLNWADPYVYHDAWDSPPNLIHATYVYVAKTGDRAFYEAHRDTLLRIGGWIAALDGDGDGLPDADRDRFPHGYYNSVSNGVRHTYALAKFYAAFNDLAELERYAGQDGGAWAERAARLRAGFHSPESGYWPAGQPWPVAWFRPDGSAVNVLETFGVFEALQSGLIAPADGERYTQLMQALHEVRPRLAAGPNPLRLALDGYPEDVLRRDIKPPIPTWMLDASVPWIVGLAAPAYASEYPEDARELVQSYMRVAQNGTLWQFAASPNQHSAESGGAWDSAAWFLAVYGGHYGLRFTPAALIVQPHPFEALPADGVRGLTYQGASVQLALDASRKVYSIQADRPISVVLRPVAGTRQVRLDGGEPQAEVTLQLEPGREYVIVCAP